MTRLEKVERVLMTKTSIPVEEIRGVAEDILSVLPAFDQVEAQIQIAKAMADPNGEKTAGAYASAAAMALHPTRDTAHKEAE